MQMFKVYLPDSTGKLELSHKSHSIIDCLLYAYGIGDFKLTNNRGLSLYFKESDFKDINCTEPFFVMIKDLLTTHELDKFKKKLRITNY